MDMLVLVCVVCLRWLFGLHCTSTLLLLTLAVLFGHALHVLVAACDYCLRLLCWASYGLLLLGGVLVCVLICFLVLDFFGFSCVWGCCGVAVMVWLLWYCFVVCFLGCVVWCFSFRWVVV